MSNEKKQQLIKESEERIERLFEVAAVTGNDIPTFARIYETILEEQAHLEALKNG